MRSEPLLQALEAARETAQMCVLGFLAEVCLQVVGRAGAGPCVLGLGRSHAAAAAAAWGQRHTRVSTHDFTHVQRARLFLDSLDAFRDFLAAISTLDVLAGLAAATHPSVAPPGCTFCRPTFAAPASGSAPLLRLEVGEREGGDVREGCILEDCFNLNELHQKWVARNQQQMASVRPSHFHAHLASMHLPQGLWSPALMASQAGGAIQPNDLRLGCDGRSAAPGMLLLTGGSMGCMW